MLTQKVLRVPPGVIGSEGNVRVVARTRPQLQESPVDPRGIVRHLIRIPIVLDPDLQLSGDIQHSTARQASIEVVLQEVRVAVRLSVGHDGLVPLGEVRVLGDQTGSEGLPLVSGSQESGVRSGRRGARGFSVGRPYSGNGSRGSVAGGGGLRNEQKDRRQSTAKD